MSTVTWCPPAELEPPLSAPSVGGIRVETRTMGPAFFDDLGAAVAAAEEAVLRGAVRAVVLYASHPKAFSYGLDLPAAFGAWGHLFRGGLAADRAALRRHILALQAPFQALFDLPAPVVCALHGHCIGGGLDLASACDIRLASADTSLSLRETRIAIVADLGSLQRLPPIIGQGLTRELAFTGRDVPADEALRMGLVNRVLESREACLQAAFEMASAIAANAPLTVQGVKACLNRAIDAELRDGLEHVATWNAAFLASADLGEAAAAFAARRPADFKGK